MKIISECVLIPKREYIIVFGVDLKLGIILRRTIVIDFIIMKFIWSWSMVFLFKEKKFFM